MLDLQLKGNPTRQTVVYRDARARQCFSLMDKCSKHDHVGTANYRGSVLPLWTLVHGGASAITFNEINPRSRFSKPTRTHITGDHLSLCDCRGNHKVISWMQIRPSCLPEPADSCHSPTGQQQLQPVESGPLDSKTSINVAPSLSCF